VERFDIEVAGTMSLLSTLHDTSITEARLKWPNDVWIRGHKLAGFLAEHGGVLPGNYRLLDVMVCIHSYLLYYKFICTHLLIYKMLIL
jgi:hypothetical protein